MIIFYLFDLYCFPKASENFISCLCVWFYALLFTLIFNNDIEFVRRYLHRPRLLVLIESHNFLSIWSLGRLKYFHILYN